MSHWVTHENPSCSHPRECLQVEFPSKETEQINPRGEQKTMVLHAFFILPSSVNQLSLHISPSLSSPLGLSPPLPGTHLFLSWASSHASLMSPYSAPVEMSIIEFTCLWGAWSQYWERKWQLIVPQLQVPFPPWTCEGESFVLCVRLWSITPVFLSESPCLASFGSMPVLWMIMAKRVFFIF